MAETIVKGVVKAKVNGSFEKMHPETEVSQITDFNETIEGRIIRGTASSFVSSNTILGKNVIGYETDSGGMKIGDGATRWVSLPYVGTDPTRSITSTDISDFKTAVNNAVNAASDTAAGKTKVYTDTGSAIDGTMTQKSITEALAAKLDASSYTPVNAASDTAAGKTKVYTDTGSNIDGTMTQKAITDALANKLNTSDYKSIPVATSSTSGTVKLYTATGSNTDGTISQSVISTNLNLKVDKTTYESTVPVLKTRAEFTSENPILKAGQLGVETDTNCIKIGNGSSKWNTLSYIGGSVNYTIIS